MKTTIPLLAVLLCLTPSEWRRVGNTRDATYYVLDTRKDRGAREVKTWERVEPRDSEAGRKYIEGIREELRDRGVKDAASVVYMTARHRYRCDEGESAFEQFLYYDDTDQLVTRDPDEYLNKWVSPAPGSIMEALMLDACKGKQEPKEYQ